MYSIDLRWSGWIVALELNLVDHRGERGGFPLPWSGHQHQAPRPSASVDSTAGSPNSPKPDLLGNQSIDAPTAPRW